MHDTRNDLPTKTRAKVIELLNARLADALDLEAQSKQAHWNVKGPNFIALHELFDKVHGRVEEHVDTIAERIVALGGTALGTVSVVAKASSLSAYPLQIVDGLDHVDALAGSLAAFGKLVRKAIDASAKLGDAGTSDLFTGVSRDIDQQLWFVEAHTQAGR